MHGFVQAVRDRGVTPHVAKKAKRSAIDGCTTRHPGYKTSLIMRKRIEEIFGWAKTVGGLRKVRFTGLSKVRAQTTFTFAAYNLHAWRLFLVGDGLPHREKSVPNAGKW